jgi:hypothetical protein
VFFFIVRTIVIETDFFVGEIEINRQENIVKEIASELDTTRLAIVHATEELVRTEELISQREEREGEVCVCVCRIGMRV